MELTDSLASQPILTFVNGLAERRTVTPGTWSTISLESPAVTGIPGPINLVGPTNDTPTAWCVYAQVRNDGNAAARDVSGRLQFADSAGTELADIPARWAHVSQTQPVEATQAPATTDLVAHGGPYRLDVAIKYDTDDECYAWNDETRWSTTDLRGVPLGEHPISVRISLIGTGLNGEAVTALGTYTLAHDGAGQEAPTLTLLSEP